jgi:hypothetical protein
MRVLGPACLAVGAFLFVRATTLGGRVVVAYGFPGGPLFTVLGDGYQEFERRLTPYLMLTPAAAMSVLRTVRREIAAP